MGNLLHLSVALGFALWVLTGLESRKDKEDESSPVDVIVLGLLLFTLTVWVIYGIVLVGGLMSTPLRPASLN